MNETLIYFYSNGIKENGSILIKGNEISMRYVDGNLVDEFQSDLVKFIYSRSGITLGKDGVAISVNFDEDYGTKR